MKSIARFFLMTLIFVIMLIVIPVVFVGCVLAICLFVPIILVSAICEFLFRRLT